VHLLDAGADVAFVQGHWDKVISRKRWSTCAIPRRCERRRHDSCLWVIGWSSSCGLRCRPREL